MSSVWSACCCVSACCHLTSITLCHNHTFVGAALKNRCHHRYWCKNDGPGRQVPRLTYCCVSELEHTMFDAWCRPRLLFQYLPYIQQEALQLAEPDIQAVLEANFGAQGLEGQWGVCPASPVTFAQKQCKQHLNGILCYCVHHSTKHDSTQGTPAATAVSLTASATYMLLQ